MSIRNSTKKFNNKLRESINTAVVAAFGFLIALVWRDVISEYVTQLAQYSPLQGKFFGAITTTFIGVIGILIITGLLSKKQ